MIMVGSGKGELGWQEVCLEEDRLSKRYKGGQPKSCLQQVESASTFS